MISALKKLLIITILLLTPLTSYSTSIPTPLPNIQKIEHPLGHPARGLLIWENEEEFLKLITDYKTLVRIAAFQTTLPDPLPGEEYNVGLAAEMLAGTLVKPGQIFSLNKTLGPRTKEKGFSEGPAYSGSQVIKVIGGGICKISTTLYNTAILADLEIIERRPHGMLVPYVPAGQDATVSYGATDFKFRNTTGKPIIIWAEKIDNTLFMAFYGGVAPPKITWRHQVLRSWKMPVYRRYNPTLKQGEERVVQSGAEGVWVKNWIVKWREKKIIETKYLGTDYYSPMPKIVEFGK